jgi:hypothetical protein
LRLGDDWHRLPVNRPEQHAELLALVDQNLK